MRRKWWRTVGPDKRTEERFRNMEEGKTRNAETATNGEVYFVEWLCVVR